jgi:hypothetical protein
VPEREGEAEAVPQGEALLLRTSDTLVVAVLQGEAEEVREGVGLALGERVMEGDLLLRRLPLGDSEARAELEGLGERAGEREVDTVTLDEEEALGERVSRAVTETEALSVGDTKAAALMEGEVDADSEPLADTVMESLSGMIRGLCETEGE